jgi:hypothetical protein
MYYELTPAYGRDYKNAAAVKADWESDKDFKGDFQLGFATVNRADIPKPCTVILRYDRDRKLTTIKVK